MKTLLVCALALVVYQAFLHSPMFDYDVWDRKTPLVGALGVTGVRDGVVTLQDGRSFRPAGVDRRERVTPEQFDQALRVATAQGVIVERDLGDGSAMLRGEPKFYNSCGTCGDQGDPRRRFAGRYLPCSVSEILLFTGYAKVDADQPGLLPKELRRMHGVIEVFFSGVEPKMTPISGLSTAFRNGQELMLCDEEAFEILIDLAAAEKAR
jgi:hypothetical protein